MACSRYHTDSNIIKKKNMKKIKFITMAFAALCLASCMGDGYADPDMTVKVPASPWGNNNLKEQNVITIAQLKSDYASPINGSSFKLIDKDIMIKGVVTGNDISGNLYNEVSLQDETGALLVCINASGLYGYLPVGQEILINLKGLYIGGYGKQAEIGGIYTNLKTGATSVGKMDRSVWDEHFKIIGEADKSKAEPEEFDQSKLGDAAYMEANAGKLMTIKKVKFSGANGKNVWAADDATTNQTLLDYTTGKMINSSQLVVRTSGYARFANAVLPDGVYDITGIFTRYNNTWQILVRNTDDLSASVLSLLKESFDESQGAFTTEDIKLADGVSHVWKWASAAYGMKASGYVNGANAELTSRLTSPAVDLTKTKSATLTFDQAINYAKVDMKQECKVQVSTDGKTWEDLDVKGYPETNGWTFVTSSADLSKYCGKTIYIGFLYSSNSASAATWEVKNVKVD